ncbi:hypothetical protein P7C73_g2506, partial [Tremellales sp. Uapishka_1]
MSISNETIVLITGANSGIGLATVVQLMKSTVAYEVLLGARSIDNAEKAAANARAQVPHSKSTVIPTVIDITSDESIDKVAQAIGAKYGRLDVLINNAGVNLDLTPAFAKHSQREILNQTFDINVTGHHVVTRILAPYLVKSSSPRVLFTGSDGGSLAKTEDPTYFVNASPVAGWPKPPGMELPGYKISKAALIMVMREWNRILKNDGAKVWSVDPGLTATNLGAQPEVFEQYGAPPPSVAASFFVNVVEGQFDEHVGRVITSAGPVAW